MEKAGNLLHVTCLPNRMDETVRRMRVGVIKFTALALAGCSVGMTPAPKTPQQPVECSDSYGAPVVDTVFTVLFGIPALAVMGAGLDSGESELTGYGALFLGLPALLYGLSAAYGYKTAEHCFKVKYPDSDLRVADDRELPGAIER